MSRPGQRTFLRDGFGVLEYPHDDDVLANGISGRLGGGRVATLVSA
jgi:hypothetical protein